MKRLTHDLGTGKIEELDVDDAYIIANRPSQILITMANTSLEENTIETISIQLVTPTLTNGAQENVAQALDAVMQFGDMVATISLDNNGAWSQDVPFVALGTYVIKALSHPSNEVLVEVI